MFVEILPLLEKNIVMYDKYIRGLIEEDTVKLHCFLELTIRVHMATYTSRACGDYYLWQCLLPAECWVLHSAHPAGCDPAAPETIEKRVSYDSHQVQQ